MISIICEILYFTILFTIGKYLKESSELFFLIPLIIFTIAILFEFIYWVRKKYDENKLKLVLNLTLTIIAISVNISLIAIVGSVW